MMQHVGILIPADHRKPVRRFSWNRENELLPQLYREIGRDLDAATICGSDKLPGGLRLWCQDDGLQKAEPEYNDRAIALCRWAGYDVAALAGPILIIGGIRGEDEAGLHPATLVWLEEGFDAMATAMEKAE